MSGSSSPFRTRTVLVLVAAGLVAMLGFLLVAAYGGQVDRQRGNMPSPTSGYATGYRALYRLIELSGGTPRLAAPPDREEEAGLLVLTPNRGSTAEEITEALADHEGPTLIVLPKWITMPQQLRPGLEERFGLLPPELLEKSLAQIAPVEIQRRADAAMRYPSGLALRAFVARDMLQSLRGPRLSPLIEASDGSAVLAEVMGRDIYILADPDLLNNLGLADVRNARAAIALLAALGPDAPGTVIFDTLLPYGAGGRNLTQLMFEPPFAGVTIALLAAALLAGIATAIRFGPVRREPRALAFGKAALIENIVTLARQAHRTGEGGARYADAVREAAARHLALPRTLTGDALDAHLDALPTSTPYSAWMNRLREAKTETDMLHAAQKLDDWRKELKA